MTDTRVAVLSPQIMNDLATPATRDDFPDMRDVHDPSAPARVATMTLMTDTRVAVLSPQMMNDLATPATRDDFSLTQQTPSSAERSRRKRAL